MKRKLALALMLVLMLLMLVPFEVLATPVTIDDNYDVDSWFYASIHKIDTGLGLLWCFYQDTNLLFYYKTSADGGGTWSNATNVPTDQTIAASYFATPAIFIGGASATDIHFAYEDNAYGPNYKKGVISANGTITWGTEYSVAADSRHVASVSCDSNGYPFVATGWQQDNGYQGQILVYRCKQNDGTWLSSDAYTLHYRPSHLSSMTIGSCALIPLAGGAGDEMTAVYSCGSVNYDHLYIRKYDAGWGGEVDTGIHVYAGKFSTTAIDDTVHVTMLESGTGDVEYLNWSSGAGMSAVTTLHSGASVVPTISYNTDSGDLAIFYADHPTNDHVAVDYYDSSEYAWHTDLDWFVEGNTITNLQYVNAPWKTDSTMFGYAYTASASILRYNLLGDQFVVNTLTPTSVLSTSAYLRGELISVGWGTPTILGFIYKVGEDPLLGGATDIHSHGNFSVGIFGNNTGSVLSPATHYHYRAYAANGETIYGNDTEFDTLGLATPTPVPTAAPSPTMPPSGNCTIAPDISTRPATYVSVSTAQLNAYLNDDGGGETAIRFQYYYGAGTWTDNETAWIGGYWNGNRNAHAHISGLIGNTTYHFRAQAYNACGNDTGADLTFTTSITVDSIIDFMAIPRVDTLAIDLQWAKPVGATEVMVRYKVGSYPGNTSDGTLVCITTMNAFAHLNLTAGETLWYSAWGKSGNNTSSTAAYAIATVTLSTSGTDTNVPGMPTNWFRDVKYTNLVDMPFYGIINWSADTFGIAREFFWMALGLILCVLVFIVAYTFTKGNLLVAALATLVIISVEVPMGLTAGFLAMLWAFPTGIIIFMKARE